MAQRALTSDTTIARAFAGLLDRETRASGSAPSVTGPANICFTSLTLTWGPSLGTSCSGHDPILLQKGMWKPVLDGPRKLLLTYKPATLSRGETCHTAPMASHAAGSRNAPDPCTSRFPRTHRVTAPHIFF